MEKTILYNIDEFIGLITAVIIGTSIYVAMVWKNRKGHLTFKFVIAVLTINLGITYIASEIIKKWDWGGYRTIVLPGIAFFGQYIVDYADKKHNKILEKFLSIFGLSFNEQINNKQNEEENKTDSGKDQSSGDVPSKDNIE